MGMYDTILIDGKCPCCGETISSFQTKDLECNLDVFEKGDSIHITNIDSLNSLVECRSKK